MKLLPKGRCLCIKSQKSCSCNNKDSHLQRTPHNMEPQGGSVEKEQNVPNICFRKVLRVKGGTEGNYPIYEPNHISWVLYLLVQTLINSAPSKLYGRHINVRDALFNSRCLISSSLRIRKWKSQMQKRGNSVLFFSLLPAQAGLSFSSLSLSYSTCFSFWSLEILQCSLAMGLTVALNSQSKVRCCVTFQFLLQSKRLYWRKKQRQTNKNTYIRSKWSGKDFNLVL